MATAAKKRIGRPMKPVRPAREPRKRIQLGLIVSAEIKARIDQEAQNSGRTQSQVAEWLIERAFHYDAMMTAMNTTLDEIKKGNLEAALQREGFTPIRSPYGKIWYPRDYPMQRSGFVPWDEGEEPKKE